jgi:hypothetical protein
MTKKINDDEELDTLAKDPFDDDDDRWDDEDDEYEKDWDEKTTYTADDDD